MDANVDQAWEMPVQIMDTVTDTREILAHAKKQAEERNLQDYVVFDVDSHIVESFRWDDVVQYIDDPVIREQALTSERGGPLWPEHRCRASIPGRGGAHSARTGAGRTRRRDRRSSLCGPDAARHGVHRNRLHGRVSHVNAPTGNVAPASHADPARQCLQPLFGGAHAQCRPSDQIVAVSAFQRSGGGSSHRGGMLVKPPA